MKQDEIFEQMVKKNLAKIVAIRITIPSNKVRVDIMNMYMKIKQNVAWRL